MPGRISELSSITGGNLAAGDKIEVVDVSDTSMAASGTNKQTTMSDLALRLSNPNLWVDATNFTWNGNTYGVVSEPSTRDGQPVTVNSARAVANWAAMQALADKIGMERKQAILPMGAIQIDGPIVLPKTDSWAIHGAGKSTIIQQNRSDCEIFDIGSLGKFFHGGAASWSVNQVDGGVSSGAFEACTASTTTTLTIGVARWTTDQWVGRRLTYIVSGVKYRARITANSDVQLTFANEITGGPMPVAPYVGVAVDGYEYVIGAQGVNAQSGELYANNSVPFTTTGYSWGQHITGVRLMYAVEQTVLIATRSVGIRFSTEVFWGSIRDVIFNGGNWGMQVNSKVGTPWSYDFDEIDFLGGAAGTHTRLSRGAIDFCDVDYGISGPCQRWGRIGVSLSNGSQGNAQNRTIIIRGGITIDNIEWYDIKTNVGLFYMVSGHCHITTCKLFENITMNAMTNSLIELSYEFGTTLHIGWLSGFQSGTGAGFTCTNDRIGLIGCGTKYNHDNTVIVDNIALAPVNVSGTWGSLPICKTGYPIAPSGNRAYNGMYGNNIKIGNFLADKVATVTTGSHTLPVTTLNVASIAGFPWSGSVIVNGNQYVNYNGYSIGSTTIAAGSNGFSLPQPTINVVSTANFPTSGQILVAIGGGSQTVTYTGITGTTFTGCSGGTGTLATGQAVNESPKLNNCSGGTGTFPAGTIVKLNTGWVLTRPSTTVQVGDTDSLSGGIGVWCNDYANDRISINKGDANYIFSLGEPTNVRFETALTASRTMTIPDKNQDGLFDGFSIRIYTAEGVVNGSNTLVIKAGATTLQTIGTSAAMVTEYIWRSNDNTGGTWILSRQDAIGPIGASEEVAQYRSGGGYVAYPIGGSWSSNNAANGTTLYISFIAPATTTIDRIGLEVTSAGSGGSVHRLGIWADNNNVPGTLLVDAGTVATDSTGFKEATVSQSVIAGARYWVAVTQQGAPATRATIRVSLVTGPVMVSSVSTGFPTYGLISTGITGALASSPTIAGGAGNVDGAPRIWLRYT